MKKKKERKATEPLKMTPLMVAILGYGARCEAAGKWSALAISAKRARRPPAEANKLWVAAFDAKRSAENALRRLNDNFGHIEDEFKQPTDAELSGLGEE